MKYKIALVFNLKRELKEGMPADYFSEYDSVSTIHSVAFALERFGNEVYLVEADKNIFDWFLNNKVDIVFNIAEGIGGASRESQVPAILEMLNIPYTGSDVLTLAIALDKAMTKRLLIAEGINTPRYQLFKTGKEELTDLKFPLIVKPNREGSGKGLTSANVVNNKNCLYEQIQKIIITYSQEALVEEYIKGRELTVAILGNNPPQVLPILEIDFSNCKESGEYFYSWPMKEYQADHKKSFNPVFKCPAPLKKQIEENIKKVALGAHNAIGCLDFSRVDIILDESNKPYVLEINPLPGLDPSESNMPFIAKHLNICYDELINKILHSALTRYSSIFKHKSVSYMDGKADACILNIGLHKNRSALDYRD